PINIPTFSGDKEEWPTFWGLFNDLVHSQPSYPKSMKFHHLRTCLSGDARKLVLHKATTPEGYDNAITNLKEYYGNTEFLEKLHVNALNSLPTVQHATFSALQAFYMDVNVHVSALIALNDQDTVSTEKQLKFFANILLMKLPLSVREDMLRDDPDVSMSMTAFCSTLLRLVKLKEACSPFQGLKSGSNAPFDRRQKRLFDESLTKHDSFLGDLEHDQDTEDYPKTSMLFTGTGEDDTYAFDSAEYCDEVSEPPDYNESPSDPQRSFESQKDSKKNDINFVSVESPPDVDHTSESEKNSSSTEEHTATNSMDSSLKRDSTPIKKSNSGSCQKVCFGIIQYDSFYFDLFPETQGGGSLVFSETT
ncbi:MAG: DUF1759 domain-containing protein, partial [Gammaproteobacteria bacterium]|nr:DUF1759 domain-containing protein [Gammaproteobacteria bacterium]